MATAAVGAIFFPFVNGSSQAIWQSKVHPMCRAGVCMPADDCLVLDPITPIIAGAIGRLCDRTSHAVFNLACAYLWQLVGNTPGSGWLCICYCRCCYMLVVLLVVLFSPPCEIWKIHFPIMTNGKIGTSDCRIADLQFFHLINFPFTWFHKPHKI
jgi:lipoprotein signal peptidase